MQREIPEQNIQADTIGNAVADFACLKSSGTDPLRWEFLLAPKSRPSSPFAHEGIKADTPFRRVSDAGILRGRDVELT